MASRKRGPPSSELQSPKRIRTRSSGATKRLPPGPACPGEVQIRDSGPLSKFPSGSDVFEAFAKIRADNDLTDEDTFLQLLATYDTQLSTLSQISAKILEVSFSNVAYKQIAPYVWLDPSGTGRDMLQLDVFRSRIPTDMFRDIVRDVDDALTQHGPLDAHENEETRSRFISSLFTRIVCVFNNIVVNKPGTLLDSEVTRKGRIEHHFVALDSVSIVFIEVKKSCAMGKQGLDVKGQVLAECAASDYANKKEGHWVPILAIVYDGNNFEFFVFDSSAKEVYSSRRIVGITCNEVGDQTDLLISIKKTCEYLFDWFIMGYINSLQSFGYHSLKRSRTKKRESTSQWESALANAHTAHWHLREGAEAATKQRFQDAETMASRGLKQLKQSVAEVPRKPLYAGSLESLWDDSMPLEEALRDRNIF
ncbi:hypothetical protein BDV38DRAFT_257966 [Aspergillus pseudotamarii]|uniref:Uncharacterized protein n=1 Tax=Aspergillus pseudotamarii TaxID=132259 RepID=A0A5N6SII4_ASPPS|nr:uncharacterized protein BDV38DRAFT_257966 [Aspergillus pseudotamarii]KAE8133560.1 hypothetical protein BDV38DRAFT_257966 [Aspergillus pseudotamarii]